MAAEAEDTIVHIHWQMVWAIELLAMWALLSLATARGDSSANGRLLDLALLHVRGFLVSWCATCPHSERVHMQPRRHMLLDELKPSLAVLILDSCQ